MLSTISAYEVTAADFFETLRARGVDLLLDVRLKNTNQLCGFTKQGDLAYLVGAICHGDYVHDLALAPTPELLERYLGHWIAWEEYARQYRELLESRAAAAQFRERYGAYHHICLLGTATKKRRSHTEILEPYLKGGI